MLSPIFLLVSNCCLVLLSPQMGLGMCVRVCACVRVCVRVCVCGGEGMSVYLHRREVLPCISDLHMRKHKYYKYYKRHGDIVHIPCLSSVSSSIFFFFFVSKIESHFRDCMEEASGQMEMS